MRTQNWPTAAIKSFRKIPWTVWTAVGAVTVTLALVATAFAWAPKEAPVAAADPSVKYARWAQAVAAAAGFEQSLVEPSPEPIPSPETVRPVQPVVALLVPVAKQPRQAAPTTAIRQSPPRFATTKWFDVGGCTAFTPTVVGMKAVMRCTVLPLNNIDEQITLELVGAPVSGRFDPPTVRPIPGKGMTILPPPPGSAGPPPPSLFIGDLMLSTLTLDTENLPPGQYTFEVAATSATYNHSRLVTVTIVSPTPAPVPEVLPIEPIRLPDELTPLAPS